MYILIPPYYKKLYTIFTLWLSIKWWDVLLFTNFYIFIQLFFRFFYIIIPIHFLAFVPAITKKKIRILALPIAHELFLSAAQWHMFNNYCMPTLCFYFCLWPNKRMYYIFISANTLRLFIYLFIYLFILWSYYTTSKKKLKNNMN